jgi:hypothetical protein
VGEEDGDAPEHGGEVLRHQKEPHQRRPFSLKDWLVWKEGENPSSGKRLLSRAWRFSHAARAL